LFSKKYGYQNEQEIQIESVSDSLRNRLWNVFYRHEIHGGGISTKRIITNYSGQITVDKAVADKLGFNIKDAFLIDKLERYVTNNCTWYEVFDFVDTYLLCVRDDKEIISKQINTVLEEEKAGYRLVNYEITPITNEAEIKEIESVIKSPYDSVSMHISKALELYSDRKNPDYENSIKESISAVEAMCSIITGVKGKNATLGNTIDKLEEKGVHIHGAMKSAFSALYGYTSDEGGIRHGSIDFVNSPAEDAKYMLVSCSAFVNYLIEKWSKINDN